MIDIKTMVGRVSSVGRWKLLFISLLFVIVLSISWLNVFKPFHIGQKVYAQAAGHKVYKVEIISLQNGNHNITDHQASTILADKYLTEKLANDAHVVVSDRDIKAVYGDDVTKQKLGNQRAYYQLKINQVYLNKLNAYTKGVYKGEYLIAHFDRNIPVPSPLLSEEKVSNPSLGNSAAIASDKKYAENFINNLYNQLEAHKITFAQAIQAEQQDTTIGLNAYPTAPHSGTFDTSTGYTSFLNANVTKAKLTVIKQGSTTKPFIADPSGGVSGAYFLVIRMDYAKSGLNQSFDQYFQQAKSRLGYKVNV